MKSFSVNLIIVFLFMLVQSYQVLANIFTTANKNIRIEVIDYRDCFEDIVFWIHHAKETPVIPQKLINNGIYPISVTIYNESDTSIKIMKNSIGGLSAAQDRQVAQMYQYDTFARIVKKFSLGVVIALVGVKLLNSATDSHAYLLAWRDYLKQFCTSSYKKIKYGTSSLYGLFAGAMDWSKVATINNVIEQAFKSQILSEESIVAPDCSMSFLLFASHDPSGYTLKVPILNEQDNQVVSFSCPFV